MFHLKTKPENVVQINVNQDGSQLTHYIIRRTQYKSVRSVKIEKTNYPIKYTFGSYFHIVTIGDEKGDCCLLK